MQTIVVVGLGYVGLTLAAAFASRGRTVIGIETNPSVAAEICAGKAPFYEHGLSAAVADAVSRGRLVVLGECPAVGGDDCVIICVGTGLGPDGQPDIAGLRSAVQHIAPRLAPGALVIVRSTVPVGTNREQLYPVLERHLPAPALAYCPERTIQGTGLKEIASLPQIVAGIDAGARARAAALFRELTAEVITVSSFEVAELAKLANNAHTDMLYAFANQLALVCERLDLEVDELLHSTNFRYPRPKLHGPGYVGGSCLTKDPYYLLCDPKLVGLKLDLIKAARTINEDLPAHVAAQVASSTPRGKMVLLCGCAYKGRPATDDLRGSAAPAVASALRQWGLRVLAHDFVVPRLKVERAVGEWVSWEEGMPRAASIVFLNDHEGYAALDFSALESSGRTPQIYDVWGIVQKQVEAAKVPLRYHRFGRGAA